MTGFVYFIAAKTVGAVKIGFSKHHPSERLKQLQCGCPIPLKLLAFMEGTKEKEQGLHGQFSGLKIHSEWFRLEGPLLDMVSRLPRPRKPRRIRRQKCPRCGETEHVRNNLIRRHGTFKLCPGVQVEGVAE